MTNVECSYIMVRNYENGIHENQLKNEVKMVKVGELVRAKLSICKNYGNKYVLEILVRK